MSDATHDPVAHDAARSRFSVVVDGVEAELDYMLDGDVLTITHTGVPPAIGGRGVAGRLVAAAFGYARAEGLRVRPACSYADTWARRHPDVHDLLA